MPHPALRRPACLAAAALALVLGVAVPAARADWTYSILANELEEGTRSYDSVEYIDLFSLGDMHMIYGEQGGILACAQDHPEVLAFAFEVPDQFPSTLGLGSFRFANGAVYDRFPASWSQIAGMATVFLSARPIQAKYLIEDMVAADRMTAVMETAPDAEGTVAGNPAEVTIDLSGFRAGFDQLSRQCPGYRPQPR